MRGGFFFVHFYCKIIAWAIYYKTFLLIIMSISFTNFILVKLRSKISPRWFIVVILLMAVLSLHALIVVNWNSFLSAVKQETMTNTPAHKFDSLSSISFFHLSSYSMNDRACISTMLSLLKFVILLSASIYSVHNPIHWEADCLLSPNHYIRQELLSPHKRGTPFLSHGHW